MAGETGADAMHQCIDCGALLGSDGKKPDPRKLFKGMRENAANILVLKAKKLGWDGRSDIREFLKTVPRQKLAKGKRAKWRV
jgi:hypothetical protein